MSDIAVSARPMWRVTAIAVALAFLVGACDMPAPEDPVTLTTAEKDLRAKTEEQRKVDGALAGAAGGAVLGALTGYLLGGWQGAAMGAATGGIAGAAIGVGYGSYMNAQARKYSNDEARAQAVTQSANSTLSYYAQVNASARQILAEQQAKVAQLNDDYQKKAITKEQYRKALSSAGTNAADLQQQLTGIDKQLGTMRADPQAAALSTQIQQLQEQRDSLKQTYDGLLQLYGTVPPDVATPAQMMVSK